MEIIFPPFSIIVWVDYSNPKNSNMFYSPEEKKKEEKKSAGNTSEIF